MTCRVNACMWTACAAGQQSQTGRGIWEPGKGAVALISEKREAPWQDGRGIGAVANSRYLDEDCRVLLVRADGDTWRQPYSQAVAWLTATTTTNQPALS